MTYEDFKNNKEIGKLIQYSYDLHKRELQNIYTSIPNIKYYDGSGINAVKKFKDGAFRGEIFFADHTTCDITINLVAMSGLDKNDRNPKKCFFISTNSEKYRPNIYGLKEDPITGVLKDDDEFGSFPFEKKLDEYIKIFEFIGFKKEDIKKVFNKELTAREAYQNVAPPMYKNRQWVCFGRKIFEFDGNIAISGDFGGIYLESFPFPFEGQPILDCSKVETRGVRFKDNKKRVKLINVNSNPHSIEYTNIKEAIIEEKIDASKVNISGTKFGEQTIKTRKSSLLLLQFKIWTPISKPL